MNQLLIMYMFACGADKGWTSEVDSGLGQDFGKPEDTYQEGTSPEPIGFKITSPSASVEEKVFPSNLKLSTFH